MAVFSIISVFPSEGLSARIGETYPINFAWSDRAWFVTTDETAQSIARKLGVSERDQNGQIHSEFGHIVVTKLASDYWGFGPSASWEWLKSEFEKSS